MTTPTIRLCCECGKPLAADGGCPICALKRALALSGQASEAPMMEQAGDRIGRYKLLEKIGEGGYGSVYMAEQADPIRRRVALKIVKLGMDTKQVIARFEAERQALALMDHPNIAKVLDAGATDTGRPYFVMELVRGIKITDYCDQHSLSTKERLNLFIQVCHAIQHAHQKGVIHRDIKPSNVLVCSHDGVPVPKVIDFGIAKATQQPLTDKTVFTAFGQFIGTPAYMSPEQAEFSGLDIDTRTDIYALGVLLYELLTGKPPFEPETLLKAGLDEMRRIIRETEPPKPSTKLATAQAATPHSALHIPQFKEVRGDLDWIVMRCLEKDRARRYETASGLAHDVLRHLSHQPVEARPLGVWYRFRKTVRRNRLAVGAAGAVALALLAAAVISAWMFLKESRMRRWAETRAYASDMGLATRTADLRIGLGGVVNMLSVWRDHKPDLRGWEWYYLNGLCQQDLMTIHAATNGLGAVAWNPEGTRLATGGADNAVRIWDPFTGLELANLHGHTGALRSVAWSPDGKRLASAGADKAVRIWDAENFREIAILRGHEREVWCVAWSPDGLKLASGALDGMTKLWDAVKHAEIRTTRSKRAIKSVSWSRDGTRLAVAETQGVVGLWDVATGKAVVNLGPDVGTGFRASVAWSPDGTRLATGGDSLALCTWDAATGTNLSRAWGHSTGLSSVAWNSDGTRLASATDAEGTIQVWNAATGKVIRTLRGHIGGVSCVAWCPRGTLLASAGGDGTAKIWDASGRNPSLTVLHQPDQVVGLAWHPDGRKLATGSQFSSVWVWDTTGAGTPVMLRGPTNWVYAVAWNPTGTLLAASGSLDGSITVWDSATATEAWRVKDTAAGVRSLAWSSDGKRLAAVGSSTEVRIWDTATRNLVARFDLEGKGAISVAWNPDNTLLAAAGNGIHIVDPMSGKEQEAWRGHADGVRTIAWSPNGHYLASAGDDGMVKVWDASRGTKIHTLCGHAAGVSSVAWSPDGTRLVTGSSDRTVKIWNPVSGIEICSLEGHPNQVMSVAWSPDGQRIASADQGGNIRIYDAAPGQAVKRPTSLAQVLAYNQSSARGDLAALKLNRTVMEQRAAQADTDTDTLNGLAWLLATCSYAEVRNGTSAVSYAERAVGLTHRKNAALLDTLAAAWAESGDFAKAISVQKEAIALLANEEAKRDYVSRLKLYEGNHPCRDPE